MHLFGTIPAPVLFSLALFAVWPIHLQEAPWPVEAKWLERTAQAFFSFYIVNFKFLDKCNPLKSLIVEKQVKYLYIWVSRRHIWWRIWKTKFSHHFQKFKLHKVGNGRQHCMQWKNRWQGSSHKRNSHLCLRDLEHWRIENVDFLVGNFVLFNRVLARRFLRHTKTVYT